jgi:preprotein translocase subunit SecE
MTTDEREDENGAAKDAPADGTADTGGEESGAGALVDARAAGAEDSDADDAPPAAALGTRLLGIERYIQGAYAVLALLLFWVFQQSVVLFWNLFAEPNVFVATAIGAVAALGATVFLYRHERFHQLTREIALELSKVTWPSREETRVSTVVVIVTSVVAALYLGVFDALWSALTDLLYTA